MEYLYPTVVAVGHVNTVLVIHCNACWQIELTLGGAGMSEEEEEAAFRGINLNPVAIAIHDIKIAVTIKTDSFGLVEFAEPVAQPPEAIDDFPL